MRLAALSVSVFVLLVFPFPLQVEGDQRVMTVGTIVPKHATPEVFHDKPIPISIRVVNRSEKQLYLQGFSRGSSRRVHFYFYHRKAGRGWKPYFESLPCNHPTCKNLHAIGKPCGRANPQVVRLGPTGSMNSIKEFKWNGLLYQQVEALEKIRKRRYCYKGLIPKGGEIRIEMVYSEFTQEDGENQSVIGEREHAAIEFGLPPRRSVYDIVIGG